MSNTLKKISFLLIFAFLFSLTTFSSFGTNVDVDLDTYLDNIGVPDDVIAELTEEQKQLIFETSANENLTFCGFDTREFTITEDGVLKEISKNQQTRDAIPSSDLTLSVMGFNSYSDAHGYTYSIYPLFRWHRVTKVNNDTFAFSMYPGWETIPGERSLRLNLCNENGSPQQTTSVGVSLASYSGYAFTVDTTTGAFDGFYIGGAYMKIKKTSSTASPNISMLYAHDTRPLFTASYGINLGAGSISITGNTNQIDVMADNFVIDGLD